MPVNSADIKFKRPVDISAGGAMADTVILTSTKNAVFPDVRSSERNAGSVLWRKVWIHFATPDGSTAVDAKLVPFAPTPAGDFVTLHPATSRCDTLGDIEATPTRAYGVGTVLTTISAGTSSLVVTVEDAAAFQVADTVLITDKASPAAATGSEEYATIATVSGVGATRTITLTAGTTNAYAAGARVASVYAYGDAVPGAMLLTKPTGAVVDASKITVTTLSSADDTWTITFSSPVAYSLSGVRHGAQGSGEVTTNLQLSGLGISILAGAFGGVLAPGDVITFRTDTAAIPVWLKRTVPAGTALFTNNTMTMMVDCESA